MKTIDPRIAERRDEVTEDRARRRLRLVLRLVVAALLVAAVVWLFRSPLLSIRDVAVSGEVRSDPAAIAAEAGFSVGVPTMSVRAGTLREALLRDPWIADAEVSVSWPGSIEIDVAERVPVAAMHSPRGWLVLAVDGAVVEVVDAAPDLATLAIEPPQIVGPGAVLDDPLVLGAVRFASAASSDLGSLVISSRDGELWAIVTEHDVRLGRPIEMEAKAAALGALLDRSALSAAACGGRPSSSSGR
jgi:cell division protein FtsQ